ncbi:MAG TPA: Lrp/AsnC family transcriptional regulator [Thiolinea sp.]|nr:Lrp/AsnC family transcriptional regulator [Thiolinea sp.]
MQEPNNGKKSRALEKQDRQILERLQQNCRQPIAEIGEQIGMSTSACHRRIKLLEDSGFIEGYNARLNPKKLGYSIIVMVEITLSSQSKPALIRFEKAVEQASEILECYLMAGDADYQLTVAARGLEDFERLHREVIGRLPGVSGVKSNMILRTVKDWNGFNL